MGKITTTKTSNPFFDCLNSILTNKKYWLNEHNEKSYPAFGINVGCSQHIDCIMHAAELNKYWSVLSPRMHYDYLFFSIRPIKRKLLKWAKKQTVADATILEILQQHYQVNYTKAVEYSKILSKKQLKEIVDIYKQT